MTDELGGLNGDLCPARHEANVDRGTGDSTSDDLANSDSSIQDVPAQDSPQPHVAAESA